MSGKKRVPGRRGKKSDKVETRNMLLGRYLIVTDAEETEPNYFIGFRDSLTEEERRRISIRVKNTKDTKSLLTTAQNLSSKEAQYCSTWIVFDRDEVKNFDEIIVQASNQNIHAAWSNPCFEIWFHAYFGRTPLYDNSQQCWKDFYSLLSKKSGKDCGKNQKNIFELLEQHGDLQKAITTAKKRHLQLKREGRKPSESNSVTNVYELIEDILDATEKI